MVALSGGGEIGPEALDAAATSTPAAPGPGESARSAPLFEQLDALERDLIARMLATTERNQSEAARRLGISRTALIDRMKKHGLS
jgi:two-component system response regulator AtoC